MDDVIIFSTSLQKYILNLHKPFKASCKHNFKIQVDKLEFLSKYVEFLEHAIAPNNIKPNPKKDQSYKKFSNPTHISRYQELSRPFRMIH